LPKARQTPPHLWRVSRIWRGNW
jgi:hypothetical protein